MILATSQSESPHTQTSFVYRSFSSLGNKLTSKVRFSMKQKMWPVVCLYKFSVTPILTQSFIQEWVLISPLTAVQNETTISFCLHVCLQEVFQTSLHIEWRYSTEIGYMALL
jgi:hypothetical protein